MNEIKKEVSEAEFVTLIIDETIDISTNAQMSAVLRYLHKNGHVEERFLLFTNIS
jgi:hypothetical protein